VTATTELSAPLTLADADGHIATVHFRCSPLTVTGHVVVDDDNDLILYLPDGTVAIVAAVYTSHVVVDPAGPASTDAANLLADEAGCAACGVDDFGRPLQRSRAVALSESGGGFGLCAHHLRRHRRALADSDVAVIVLAS